MIYNFIMNKIYLFKNKIDHYDFVKTIAARKYNISKKNLNILFSKHGKPYFENIMDFHFNISHSKDLITVAISESPVGIDIEYIRNPDLRIAKRFCDEEYNYITERDSTIRFFEIWTKKEAYLKYKGTGLSGGLKSINTLNCDTPIKSYKLGKYILSVCGNQDYDIIN